jgi:hypothetical protein
MMPTALAAAFLWISALQDRAPLPDTMEPDVLARCQAATVLVEAEVPVTENFGGGFFVNDRGYIVTSLYPAALAKQKGDVTVVVNSGQADQKRYEATIVQIDRISELALLKIEADGTAWLPLGDEGRLAEADTLWSFGYPLSKLPARGDAGPSVTVTRQTVTALRKSEEGALNEVQTDLKSHTFNTGGPLVGGDGQVLGIIATGIRSVGSGRKIYVSRVSRFLAGRIAGARVVPERLGENGGRVRIEADIFEILQKAEGVSAWIDGGDRVVEVAMNREAGGWAAVWEAPAIDPSERDRIEATLIMRDRTVRTGRLRAPAFTLKHAFGALAIPAGEILEIRFGEGGAPDVVRTAKGTFEGELAQRAVDLGEEIPAARIASATFVRPAGKRYAVTIRARLEGKEVGTEAGTVVLEKPARTPESIEVAMKGDHVLKRMPGPIYDIKPAAGGRMLAVHFKTLRTIGLFDVSKLEFARHIPLAEEEALFAAGRTKLVVCYPAKSILVRYDLRTMEKELTVPTPFVGVVRNLEMGWNSDGPALLCWTVETRLEEIFSYNLLDVEWMKLVGVDSSGPSIDGAMRSRETIHLRVSGDGRRVGAWTTKRSDLRLGQIADSRTDWSSQNVSVGFVLPGYDGEYLYTQRGLFTRSLKAVEGCKDIVVMPIPGGVFYLSVHGQEGSPSSGSVRASIHALSNHQKLLTLDEPLLDHFDSRTWDRTDLTFDKRVWPIPQAKILVTVPLIGDSLVIRRFDPEAALEASGIDYLFVASAAPTQARAGTPWEYPVAVRSKRGGAKFKLEIAPDGMTVDEKGRISWTPQETGSFAVVLLVSDAGGQEVYHQFTITVP